jgi:hypothetical protein
VVASTRSIRRAVAVVLVALGSVAMWFGPMIAVQPGGVGTWLHATRVEAAGAAHTSSIFSTGTGGVTNLGTFGAWTLLTLGPVLVVGLLALLVLGVLWAATRRPVGDVTRRIWSRPGSGHPWYQRPGMVLSAAVLPPVAVVTLVQFAKGGYVLAYLPAATIGALVPAARLVHHRRPGIRRAGAILATVAVAAVCAWNVERFTEAWGILPGRLATDHPSLWISQARYQAPYADTAATIADADRADRVFATLGRRIDPRTDVVVSVAIGPGLDLYRNMGFALPGVRVSLVSLSPPVVLYTELHGLLYYGSGTTIALGPGGTAWFLTAPGAPDLSATATPAGSIDGLRVWRVTPGPGAAGPGAAGVPVAGITVTESPGPRSLGGGIR